MRPEERQREEDFSAKKFSMESPIFELEKEREREREKERAARRPVSSFASRSERG